MQERCPNCDSVTDIEWNICRHCGQELTDFGYVLEASTYWVNGKISGMCAAMILGGIVCMVLIGNSVPAIAGFVLAGFYYSLKYEE